jgi:xylulokinase
VLKWYRNVLGTEERREAEKKKINVYDYLFSELTFEPSGIYVLPYFSATGTPYHDPVAKGTIIGLNLSTKKKDIFKALVEGLVYEIAFNIELAEKSGIKIKELRSVGGGAKADSWLQLKSSVVNKPIKRMKITEAGCLATMVLAGSGTGKFNISEAISNFVKVDKQFYPDENIRQKYLEGFNKYKKIYSAVSKIY